MNEYIQGILDCYHHAPPKKPHLYPHKHTDICYGSTFQYAAEADSSPPLDTLGIKRVQGIVGALLYYARYVGNKLIIALNTIGSQKASTIELTLSSVTKLINYVSTYPNYGITHHTSSMVLSGHSDASLLN